MNWTSVANTFIANLPLVIAAIVSGIVAIKSLNKKLDDIQKSTDGLATKFASAAEAKGVAEGTAAGVEAERTRSEAKVEPVVTETVKNIAATAQNTAKIADNTERVEAAEAKAEVAEAKVKGK